MAMQARLSHHTALRWRYIEVALVAAACAMAGCLRLATAADVYASSTAAGANNGTNWANAYTNLQTAVNACAAGDRLFTNAPWGTPFHLTATVSNKDHFLWVGNQGPDRATVLFGGIYGSGFVDVGGGTGDFAKSGIAAKPFMVAYDVKQDDYLGTVTKCAITPEIAAFVGRLGWSPALARQWYGFLAENTSTPTTPGDGQWGWDAGTGTLLVDPPGAPTLGAATPLIVYSDPAVTHGVYAVDCDHSRIEGVTTFWYPVANGNDGYGLRGDNCTDFVFAKCVAHVSGWHSIGFAGGYAGNVGNYDCRVVDCFANGVTGDETGLTTNCLIFFQYTAPTRWGNNYGVRNVCIPTPRLLATGLPTMSNWGCIPLLSHAASGSSMNGIHWIDNLGIDFTTQLASNGATNTSRGVMLSAANTPTPANPLVQSDYPIQSKRNVSIGRMTIDRNSKVAYEGDLYDRSGHGVTSGAAGTMISGSGAAVNIWAKNLTLLTGNYADVFFTNIDSGDTLYFDGLRALMQGTVNRKGLILQGSDTGTVDNVYLANCEFESDDNTNHSPLLAVGTTYTNNLRDVFSYGNNRFGAGCEGSLQHTNPVNAPQNMTWWRTNVNGGSTDAGLLDFNWGATAAAKVDFVRQRWLRENLPPRAYVPSTVVIAQ